LDIFALPRRIEVRRDLTDVGDEHEETIPDSAAELPMVDRSVVDRHLINPPRGLVPRWALRSDWKDTVGAHDGDAVARAQAQADEDYGFALERNRDLRAAARKDWIVQVSMAIQPEGPIAVSVY
jgi:hypothetical protein